MAASRELKLHASGLTGLNTFSGYGKGFVLVNGERRASSLTAGGLIVMADQLLEWPVQGFAGLSTEDFALLADLHPEVVLLGTGDTLRFPHPRITRALSDARIGVEVMDIQAACRTYNILVAEERKVAAALVFD